MKWNAARSVLAWQKQPCFKDVTFSGEGVEVSLFSSCFKQLKWACSRDRNGILPSGRDGCTALCVCGGGGGGDVLVHIRCKQAGLVPLVLSVMRMPTWL